MSHTLRDMSGFTKLFGSIVNSTIWREDKETKIVWITMLAMADKDGLVEASFPGLADASRVSLEECRSALDKLMSPDEYSRTKDHEGRRIKEVDGGWVILNHAKYRHKMSEDYRKEQDAKRQRNFRDKRKSNPMKRMTDGVVSASYKARERRFVAAEKAGNQTEADAIASEGLQD
jgi:hypothetical protein